jgi:hypothetical protein
LNVVRYIEYGLSSKARIMTFQSYLDNIEKKTGKTPADFFAAAKEKGLVGPELTAGRLVAWLKEDFSLGHGHAMAIWAVFKSKSWTGGSSGDEKPAHGARKRK